MTTTRERLLSKNARRYRDVKLPDGDVFTIRNLSERERTEQELQTLNRKTAQTDVSKLPAAKLRMIAACLVDSETKEAVISPDEWQLIGDLDSAVTSRLYAACLEHNGFEDEEVEELVGNSD